MNSPAAPASRVIEIAVSIPFCHLGIGTERPLLEDSRRHVGGLVPGRGHHLINSDILFYPVHEREKNVVLRIFVSRDRPYVVAKDACLGGGAKGPRGIFSKASY